MLWPDPAGRMEVPMKYDFDKLTNRSNTFSMKWDVKENELPMWVADMDFETAPVIADAIRRKAEHAIFGYTIVPDAYYDAVVGWWAKRHRFHMEKEWIIFASGVVPAISSIVRKMTRVGENVLIQPPVYNIFYNSILNNGRFLTENRLIYQDGEYHIDFVDLEQKLSNPQTTMMILCNPHNPVGKVWDKDILNKIGKLCARHMVLVLSDEIHCDLTHPGVDYTPFASVSDICAVNSITCTAPSKTFNLAGLQSANVIVPNPILCQMVKRGLNTDEAAEPNAFAMEAAIAAYTEGDEWLEELRIYIKKNVDTVTAFIGQNIPEIKVTRSEATYLLWLDCQDIIHGEPSVLCDVIRRETGLYLSAGAAYGGNGNDFLRMNVGTQHCRVSDGLKRLQKGILKYRENVAD